MAGAGYKLFNTGDVLTAAQVNTYLQEQVVMVFANAAARTTALSGVLAEGMVTYLKDTDALEIYSGAAWVGYGSGDITAVTTAANSGLAGGATSGAVALNLATVAKGDLLVGTGSGTAAVLTVGANNTTLVADSTQTTGLKWAATTSGSLTKISSNAFSNVASVAIDGCFTSTYTDYLVIINNIFSGTSTDDLQMQLRYSATTQATDYYGSSYVVPFSGSNSTIQTNAANQFTLANNTGNTTYRSTAQIFFSRVGNTSESASWRGQMLDEGATEATHFAGKNNTARTYTGLLFKSSSSNITGNITIYGLEK